MNSNDAREVFHNRGKASSPSLLPFWDTKLSLRRVYHDCMCIFTIAETVPTSSAGLVYKLVVAAAAAGERATAFAGENFFT